MEPRPKSTPSKTSLDAAIILAAAMLITVPFHLWGIPHGNDFGQHYQFAQQFESSIRDGGLYPSWGTGSNNGLGDVGVRFYPPLSYYVLLLFKAVTGSYLTGSALTFAFWFFLGSLGCYLWAREWLDRPAAIMAGLVFMVLPYHANQIFNAFLYAEFAAASLLPFCFLFVARLSRAWGWGSITGLAAAIALLILTHIPTTIMAAIALAVYSLLQLKRDSAVSTLKAIVTSVLLGAAASSFYWIKVVAELPYVNHASAEFTSSSFDFRGNFLAAYLYISPDQYASRALLFADLMLLLTICVAVSAIVVRAVSGTKDGSARPLVAILAVGVLFATPLSVPIWESVGILQKIQFPFRWMTVVTLAAAMLAGCAFRGMTDLAKSSKRPAALIAFGAILFCVAFTIAQVIRPAIYIEDAAFEARLSRLKSEPGCECWLPVWARREGPRALFERSEIAATISVNGGSDDLPIQVSDDGLATVPVFYYPYWRVISGKYSRTPNHDEYGRITFALDAVDNEVKLQFDEPRHTRGARIVSGIAWLLILLLAGFTHFESRKTHLAA